MEKMTAQIKGITTRDKEIIQRTTKQDLELAGGHAANICYTQKSYDEIISEPKEKTLKRADDNKHNRHHSVFGHDEINIYFEGIPKIIAMMINNEHEYNTSEKSGRYTTMFGSDEENELYNKWLDIFKLEIKKKYPNEPYLTDTMITKKAKENARYLLSIFMRTKMEYTTSYRQWNYLYDFANKMIQQETNNRLIICLKPYLEEFKFVLEKTGFISDDIKDYRDRKFSLIEDDNTYDEHFSRSYSVNYKSTIPALADLLRHRTLDYSFSLIEPKEYYVPQIIRDNPILVREWLKDISSLSEFPQGMLVNVNETGKYEDFIMKLYERLCTAAQLEVAEITKETLTKYVKVLEESDSPNDKKILEKMKVYTKGARCSFPGFECQNKCYFKEGINFTRKI